MKAKDIVGNSVRITAKKRLSVSKKLPQLLQVQCGYFS